MEILKTTGSGVENYRIFLQIDPKLPTFGGLISGVTVKKARIMAI